MEEEEEEKEEGDDDGDDKEEEEGKEGVRRISDFGGISSPVPARHVGVLIFVSSLWGGKLNDVIGMSGLVSVE